MSRVLLFVANGDRRPKVVPNPGRNDAARRLYAAVNPHNADRWFLVECDSAAGGRRLIECEHPTKQCAYNCASHGRILAQGGKTP